MKKTWALLFSLVIAQCGFAQQTSSSGQIQTNQNLSGQAQVQPQGSASMRSGAQIQSNRYYSQDYGYAGDRGTWRGGLSVSAGRSYYGPNYYGSSGYGYGASLPYYNEGSDYTYTSPAWGGAAVGNAACCAPANNCCPTYCYVPRVTYCPRYYSVRKCEYIPQYCYKRCCTWEKQYFQKPCVRYVPEYYCVTCCRDVPRYHYECECNYCPRYYCERKCTYEPRCTYECVVCPNNQCCN